MENFWKIFKMVINLGWEVIGLFLVGFCDLIIVEGERVFEEDYLGFLCYPIVVFWGGNYGRVDGSKEGYSVEEKRDMGDCWVENVGGDESVVFESFLKKLKEAGIQGLE